MVYGDMNKIKNIAYGLTGGTFGITALGAIDGGPILAITAVALGGAALVTSLMVRHEVQRKKLDEKVMMDMR